MYFLGIHVAKTKVLISCAVTALLFLHMQKAGILMTRLTHHAFEPHHEKTNILVSDLVRNKSGYTATEDG